MIARNEFLIIDGTGSTIEIEAGELSTEIDAAKELRAVVRIGIEAFCGATRFSGDEVVRWA